ncbi:hypothetical protein ACHAW5_003086 [Stephanodiscus triporus]|uniref:Uncharacterized protein n=1 Tax=Stephanodiscus triporus TaxID=2934178 RepID=A0ABD3MC69_9STRA
MANQHRLRDPEFIKLMALTTSILAVSIVSIGFIARAASGRENSPSARAVPGGSDGSRKLMEGWDGNGWSSGEWPSKMSKCGKSGGGSSGWSVGKSGKSRRLGESWASVWGPPTWDEGDDESKWQPSSSADWGGSWYDDDDCGWSADESHSNELVFVKDGKSAKSKSSKSKSAKSKSSKITSTTNDWTSPWTWNPPSKTTDVTDSAKSWSSPWTPPSEPWWGSSSWKATPAPTPGDEPTWRSSTWKASPKPTTEDKPTWGSSKPSPKTEVKTEMPSYFPTKEPTPSPTDDPTLKPTDEPSPKTEVKTEMPSPIPTEEPTPSPTDDPTLKPTDEPSPKTEVKTEMPSPIPTEEPTRSPTDDPTLKPTGEPSAKTEVKTDEPTPCSTSPTCPTPEPEPTPEPSPTEDVSLPPTLKPSCGTSPTCPTPMPTVCTEQQWYFDDQQCTRGPGMIPDDNEILYPNPESCCLASGFDYPEDCPVYDGCYPKPTPQPSLDESTTPMPTACEERLWYFNSGICTNGYDMPIDNGNNMYSTLKECCEMNGMINECSFNDVCLEVFTYSPTFGSTPTVSKETTGPPTLSRNNV